MESARIANVPWPAPRKDLLTALLASGLAAFALVVLLLLARRIAGALVQPLGGFSLVGIVGLGLLLAVGWRLGGAWGGTCNQSHRNAHHRTEL